jgi:hypothetical protein
VHLEADVAQALAGPRSDLCLKADNNYKIGVRQCHYFTIRGGSLKKIAKKIIPKVPTNKNV